MANFKKKAAFGMAEKMGKNATEADVKNVADKMSGMNRGPLAKCWGKVVQLWDAFKSPKTPAYVKAIIIGGLIYMVSPVDMIPDAIPVAGLVDDAGVIGLVFRQFLKLMPAAAVGGAVVAIIKLEKITVAAIRKAVKEKYAKAVSVKIKTVLENGDYNRVNCGLHDESGKSIGEVAFEGKEISRVKEGMEIKI